MSGFNRAPEQHTYDTSATVLPPPPEGWPRGVEWNLEAYKKYKAGKMSLTGVRNRSRKRDVKKKFEPEVFAEEVIRIIDEAEGDLDEAFAQIQHGVNDSASAIDFETYGDTFWEIFIAGGVVAPGGEVSREEGKYNDTCVLEISLDRIPELNKLANNVLQRHRFMRVILEDVLCKVCMFVEKYNDDDQQKLARFMSNFIIEMQAEASMVTKLQQEKSLVDSGEALRFATTFFKEFLAKSSPEKLSRALKAGKADRVLTLLPSKIRTPKHLFKHFNEAGLTGYCKYLQTQTWDRRMEDLAEGIEEVLGDADSVDVGEAISVLQSQQALSDGDVVSALMYKLHEVCDLSSRNRAKEYMKYVMGYADIIGIFTTSKRAEGNLMKILLEHIMEDSDLELGFMPTCQALYDHELNILSEDSIMTWLEEAKAKSDDDYAPYIEKMEQFAAWLNEAEEDAD